MYSGLNGKMKFIPKSFFEFERVDWEPLLTSHLLDVKQTTPLKISTKYQFLKINVIKSTTNSTKTRLKGAICSLKYRHVKILLGKHSMTSSDCHIIRRVNG